MRKIELNGNRDYILSMEEVAGRIKYLKNMQITLDQVLDDPKNPQTVTDYANKQKNKIDGKLEILQDIYTDTWNNYEFIGKEN